MNKSELPSYIDLMFPVLEALAEADYSARREEIVESVSNRQGFSNAQLEQRYEHSGVPIIRYRIGWALNYLEKIDAVENSSQGVWSITESGENIDSEEKLQKLIRAWREKEAVRYRKFRRKPLDDNGEPINIDELDEEAMEALGLSNKDSPQEEPDIETIRWQDQLLQHLLEISPAAFERLTKRLLLETGFRDVQVQSKSGDGGIGGVGVYRLSLMSFPTYFQCKRYRGSVSAGAVRDFRGTMAGRGEKGLLVTTGTFTREARKESSRDGAPPVELIDGEELCDLLKEHQLGVTTKLIEHIEINTDFFDHI